MRQSEIFKKYIKERKSTDHAELSASGAERWLSCPKSVQLSKGIPSVTNEAAERGTNAHTLLQFVLENPQWKELLKSKAGEKFLQKLECDSHMWAGVMFAAKCVWNEMGRLRWNTSREPQIFTEIKLHLDGVGFGTSDIILYQPFGILHVMDYKNGTKAVNPENNMQALYYAHAAADKFNWEFAQLKITIIQPNAPHSRGQIRSWEPTEQDLVRAGVRLKRGALMTKKKDAPLVKGEHCFFCVARPTCPAHVEYKTEKLLGRFRDADC